MEQRILDEMITYFNQEVSKMDIDRSYKMALLGMICAIGAENKKQEIIRCKDCRHWGRINQYENGTTDIDCKMGLSCDPNGFCHRAVQREESNDQ